MQKKESSNDFERAFSRTGNARQSIDILRKKGYKEDQIEELLKNTLFLGKEEKVSSTKTEKKMAKSFLLKFVVVCISSGLTVLAFFLVK